MSWAFELLHVPSGAPPEVARAAFETLHRDTELAAANLQQLAARAAAPSTGEQRRLADAIRSAVPTLERTHDSALHVELSDMALALQVSVRSGEVGVEIYGNTPDHIIAALQAAWDCMAVCAREAQLVAYDPQIDRLLDLSRDFELVLAAIAGPTAVEQYQRSRG